MMNQAEKLAMAREELAAARIENNRLEGLVARCYDRLDDHGCLGDLVDHCKDIRDKVRSRERLAEKMVQAGAFTGTGSEPPLGFMGGKGGHCKRHSPTAKQFYEDARDFFQITQALRDQITTDHAKRLREIEELEGGNHAQQ